jgi:hypothetical protein
MIASLAVLTTLIVAAPPASPPSPTPPPADNFRPEPAWKPQGPNLWFDPQARRLILRGRVVLREGPLEHLLCLKGTKEHEAILATDAIPMRIHLGLILTGAVKGQPVQFLPKFAPPTGEAIAIELEWEEGGQLRHADARTWIKDEKTGTLLKTDWVFAGSDFFDDPITKTRVYMADDGDLVTVANFASAILDLPFASTADDAGRVFVANTDRIPPRGTPVTMHLHPRKPSGVPKNDDHPRGKVAPPRATK